MKMVDNVSVVTTHGDSTVFLVKGKPLTGSETPREALIGCSSKVGSHYSTLVRSSIEMDNHNKVSEGFMRQLVLLSGLFLVPTEKNGVTRVTSMCYCDTNKAYSSESLKVLENLMIESAIAFKKNCETSI